VYDCLIGINLLREGLDLPEVSLVAILDADKQGFLRSTRSLIQTIGRAARNVNGEVIMYADKISESMEEAINETNRRRKLQQEFNIKNGTNPVTIKKDIMEAITIKQDINEKKDTKTYKTTEKEIKRIEAMMKEAAKNLDFEKAVELRDLLIELKAEKH
jgi:excinuclease ABC subunit B